MPRQILIVDAVATNRIVLKVKLASAFYNVDQARTGQEALTLARNTSPAIIIVGTLNDMSSVDLCKMLKSDRSMTQPAVVMLSCQHDIGARLTALRAGADDVIGRPYDDAVLLARLRSLYRSRDTEAELQLRESTHRALGLSERAAVPFDAPGLVTVIAEDRGLLATHVSMLRRALHHRIELRSPRDLLRQSADPRRNGPAPDTFLLALTPEKASTELKLLPEFRTWDGARQAGILVMAPEGDRASTAGALDLGADDVVSHATSGEELALRIDRLVERKRRTDMLKNTVRAGLRAAVTDPLTGLHNRRFALPHLARVADHAATTRRGFAVMIADLDHFKQINDRHGHAAGDAVLVEVAKRFPCCLRPVDLVARIGGEEFLIVLPDVTGRAAQLAADRLRTAIADHPFELPGRSTAIQVTVSIGVAMEGPGKHQGGAVSDRAPRADALAESLLARADRALYGAKAHGRNQVELTRPAA